ncbi:acetoacetate decarboxylase (ADC) [Rhizobium sp. CECT 9324]|uniref:acetoacetate decarboxylase (ADC) n=1 Tax=Rhizobium sp. CECT 9324 TaxID=2845820 RepID=UPI001E43E819|nr:acetoacetate decarboxylase (ADC) [Rhizobium sp. CECT 9324]CAH0338841.1 hypothetical protein RHI9324_00473 [Rhizobium sp. CECT 9324]
MQILKSRSSKILAGLVGGTALGVAVLFAPSLFVSKAVFTAASGKKIMNVPVPGEATADQKLIDLAGHQVPVVKDGLYDRFRSNPLLSVIEEERPDLDLTWFKTLKKQKKEVGFTTYSPNFYYSNSSITAIYTADMGRIKELMPEQVRRFVQPISFMPGKGLIAITSYNYNYCDNDSYNELSISIVTTKPNKQNFGLISLMGQISDNSLWGYVLKLPVDTELARVRGVAGYNLPKWLIPIEYNSDGGELNFTYYDEQGKLDFSMSGKKLELADTQPKITRVNFTNLDAQGRLTHGFSDIRALKSASSREGGDVQLGLSDGPLSIFIKSLGLKDLIRYDYQPDFQAALYTPELVDKK